MNEKDTVIPACPESVDIFLENKFTSMQVKKNY